MVEAKNKNVGAKGEWPSVVEGYGIFVPFCYCHICLWIFFLKNDLFASRCCYSKTIWNSMVRNQPGASLREFGDASAGAACAAVEKRPTHPFCTEVRFEVKEDILNFETILELMHSLN